MSHPPNPPDLARIVTAFAGIPHCRLLGMRLDEVRRGSGMMSLDWDEKLIGNPRTRVVHSGVVTALLDTLCGLVVMASVAEGTPLATLDLRIDYLRPATPEQMIRAAAECYKVTASVAFVRGLAFHENREDAIAHCAGTFMLGGVGFSATAAVPAGRGDRGPARGRRSMLKSLAELRARGDLAAINDLVPYARTVGLELLRDEAGLLAALRFREHNIGNFVVRAIHGGVVGALLEHAAMMHLLVETDVQVVPRIVNVSIDYLRPCRAEDTFARGSIIRQGRTVANVRITAWQGDDPTRLVAAAHAHFLLI